MRPGRPRNTPSAALAGLVALLVLLAAACGTSSASQPLAAGAAGPRAAGNGDATTSSELATTTTEPVIPTWPLTGQIAADAAAIAIPVVAAKVDNSPDARPHAGINDADVVYELQVEGITRFMEVFHSASPERVGPVRSARSSDIDLFGNLNRPMLLWSGGNPGVTGQVKQAEAEGSVFDVGHTSAAGSDYYRDNGHGRVAPHNLYTSVPTIRANWTLPGSGPPGSMFSFRGPAEALPASAVDAPGMTIDFGLNVRVEYVWDGERSCWDRFQVDQRHPRNRSAFVDEGGVQVCPANVVVLFVPYGQSEADARSPKALTVGEGEGIVLSAGKVVGVRWHRSTPGDGWNLTDAATGGPVGLTAGRTWVALPQQDQDAVVPMDAALALGLLELRA